MKHNLNDKPKFLISVIAFLIIVILIIVFCFAKNVFFFGTLSKDITFDSIDDVSSLENNILMNVENPDHIYGFNGNILKWQTRQIVWLDKNGNQTKVSDGEINQPIFDSSNKYLVVAEKGQSYISVYKNSSLLWSDELDGEIYNVSVNQKGYVCVLRSYVGYKSALEVYNPTGARVFYTCKAHNKIISAQVSDDSKQVLIHSVVLSGVDVVSHIELLDMSGQTVASYELDQVCFAAKYINSNKIMIVDDNSLLFMNDKLEVYSEKNNLTISDVVIMDNNMIAVLGDEVNKSDEFSERTIMIFNIKGQLIRELHLENNVTAISEAGNNVAINFGNMFIVVSDKGNIKGGCKTERNIQRIKLINNSYIAALTGDKAYICKI